MKRGRSLQWWHENKHRFPNVYALAKKVLVAQATQCDVERNLSHASFILSYLRNNLDDETFHQVLFLYENRHLWGIQDAVPIFGNE